MNNLTCILIDTLKEFKAASSAVRNDDDYKKLIHKYDIVFMGENLNVVQSLELAHYLKNNINSSITHDQIIELLPNIASDSFIKLEALITLDDAGKPDAPVANYMITLL